MAPRRITRSGASHKTPVTPRINRDSRKTRTSPRKTITGSNQTLSKILETGPAEPIDLDDVCSDLSSVHSTPRQQIRGASSGFGRPSRSPNTSSKRESGVRPLERAGLPDIPTRALQTTGGDTSRHQILDSLVRDVTIPPTNPSAFSLFLDRHHPLLGTDTPPLFCQPHPAPFPSIHNGSDASGVSLLSPPSGVAPTAPPPAAYQPNEKSVVMRPTLALAQAPIPTELPIATSSPFSSTHDFAPPPSLQSGGVIPVAHRGDSVVSDYPSNPDTNSPPQHLPSTLQRNTFLTDIRSSTPDYSPPASPLHGGAPSEDTIDLCFSLVKRREATVLQDSPVSPLCPEDPNNAPSPLSAINPSPATPSVKPSEPPHYKTPDHEPIDLITDDQVASTSPLGSSPSALELGLDNCAVPRPLRAAMRSHNTSLHATLAQRALQPPFSCPSALFLTPSPPPDNVTNQDSEDEQEEGRRAPTPARHHEQEGQQGREDTPFSNIVSETTQEEMRSTSGDSFVLSTTSPFFQSSSKISFVHSSIAYQVALRQKSILPLISTSSTAETYNETGVVDMGTERLPTHSVHEPDSVTLETPRELLEKETTFYASIRKKRIFRKDELADSEDQSNPPIRSSALLPALTDNEEDVEEPKQWTLHSKRPMVMRVVADSDSYEDESTSESTLLEQERRRRRRRRVPLVQSSSPGVESEEREDEVFATTLGSTAAAPIVLDSDPETEVDVHPMRSPSVISVSSGDEAREKEAEAELPITVFDRSQQESTAPAPSGRFLCVEVPTLQQLQRAQARATGKLVRDWTGRVHPRQRSGNLRIASQTGSSPRKPRLLSSLSSSEDELFWGERDGREEDGGLVTTPNYTQCLQRTHTGRFGDAKTRMGVSHLSRPPAPRTSPKKCKIIDTNSEGDTDELDEWVPEPALPTLGPTRGTPDTETNSAAGDTMSRPALSTKRPRGINRGGPIVVQFQCTIPGASFARPPLEPFRNSVAQANASIKLSTIRAPRFTSRGSGCSFGCHNCRSSTDKNVKIRCSNFDQDTGGQCMHHWCERCLVMWYGFDGRGLLSAYAFSGEELGPKEIKALGSRGTDGGVGLGLGVIPGKWVCPNCVGKCMCTYCTKKDGRSRSRFKNDTVGIPLDLEGLEGLEVAPGLRGIRPKEKKKQSVDLATSSSQPITPGLVSGAGFSTQNGEASTSNSMPAPRRPRITRELQDLFTPEFGHAVHVNDHGEFQIYKQDAAGNVVCVGVPTRKRTRACPDGAPESMGGVGVSVTELYKPIFLPGERERWRKEVGLVEESGRSDSEFDADRSVPGEVEDDLVDGLEGLPRRANFVNVPWGAKLPRAQKRVNIAVQARPENREEGDIPPITAQASRDSIESGGNLGQDVEPSSNLSQFDVSSLFNFGAESEMGAAGDVDLQGERHFTSMEDLDTVLYTMEPLRQVPSTGSVAHAFPHPVLDLAPAQEWGSWETMALEFGDPSFDPLPSCGPLTVDGMSTVPAGAPDTSSQSSQTPQTVAQ